MDKSVLGAVGVGEDEESVYRILLQHPGLTATSLRTRTGASTTRVRRALEGLERKAMVTRRGGTPVTFQPTPPDIVIDTLVAQREKDLRQVRLQGTALLELFRQPTESAQATDIVEVLTTREAATERWLQLQFAIRERLDVLVRPPFGQTNLVEDENVQTVLLNRGVKVRGVYDQEAMAEEGIVEHIRNMGSLGEQARIVSQVPVKLALFDRRAALVPLTQVDPSSAVHAGLVIHESALLDALLSLFDSLWERGYAAYPTPGTTSQRADEDAVFKLLASGMKDGAVARQLGVSTNTVRRRISSVLTRLGVSTRFQAGLVLGREDAQSRD